MGQLKEYIFLALKSYIHLDLSSVCELLLGRVAVHSSSTAVSKTFLQKSFKVNLQIILHMENLQLSLNKSKFSIWRVSLVCSTYDYRAYSKGSKQGPQTYSSAKAECSSGICWVSETECHGRIYYQKQVCVPDAHEAKQYQNAGVWNRERVIAGPCKDKGWLLAPNPKLSKASQESILKGKVRERVVGCCKLPVGILCYWSCLHRSGHNVPVTSSKTNVILCCATFYLYMNRKEL